MSLPVFQNLDTVGRPSGGGTLLTAWGDAVNDDINFLAGEAAWTPVTFLNGWHNYSTPTFEAASYRLFGNEVVLKGAIAGGTVAVAAFVLPAGYRPLASRIFVCSAASNAMCGVTVDAAGNVIVNTGASNAYVDLGQISFYVN